MAIGWSAGLSSRESLGMSTNLLGTKKQRLIYESVRKRIEIGDFKPGDRIPSDSDLVREFGVSRPTVAKALRELEKSGLVQRRAGSGTYVLQHEGGGKQFGLLIPGLGDTEIFEPICGEMARVAHENGHTLLWGGSSSSSTSIEDKSVAAWNLCQTYIQNQVGGVFFAPIELADNQDQMNHQIIDAFTEAKIPIVLLDRDYVHYPERSTYDLVGIDNRRVGFTITKHLIDRGCKKILFFARPGSASTIDARIAGFMEAKVSTDNAFDPETVFRGDPKDRQYVQKMLDDQHCDGIVCGNDVTAGHLMRSLEDIGVSVPSEVMVAGIDDVKYAELLRVPLTTVHQPCSAIGDAAFCTMMQRIQYPDAPARNVLLECELIVRDSTLRNLVGDACEQ